MTYDAEKAAVSRALRDLEDGLAQFVNALGHSDAECFLEQGGNVRRACEAYTDIDYGMQDEVNSSIVCYGALGVGSDLLKRAAAVNSLKANLKKVCAPMSDRRVRVRTKDENSPTEAIPLVRFILRNIQRSDLNLLAAYRKIPTLGAPPVSITYTRANTRSVYRKSVDELYTMLNTMDGPIASSDRAQLSTLDPRETHLALVRHRYQNIRANILYARLDRRGRGRVQIAAELPILYPRGSDKPEIRFLTPGDENPIPSHEKESKIEDQPFLRTLPVYRYLA